MKSLMKISFLIAMTQVMSSCSKTSWEHIKGPYYLETNYGSGLPHDNYARFYLYYKNKKTIQISNKKEILGSFGTSKHRQFTWKVFGDNIAYVSGTIYPAPSAFWLVVYSEKNGKIIVDKNFSDYWKVIVNDSGITCHRYQNGDHKEDPSPVFYSADYIKNL